MKQIKRVKIAICNDIFEFQANRLLNPDWASKFPGANWVSFLNERAQSLGWEVASGDIALTHIQSGYWNARDIFVVQELNSTFGARLLKMGANPLLLTALESPLYASVFYDQLPQLISQFPEWMVPEPIWLNYDEDRSGRCWPLRFPCIQNLNEDFSQSSWVDRKKLSLIAANKYWANSGAVPSVLKLRQFIGYLKMRINIIFSASRSYAVKNQLHDRRLELVEYFSKIGWLDLYGRGWGDLENLPKIWQERLKNIRLSNNGPVPNKIDTLSQYQFSICYENVSTPGYVTEKIIECLLAQTIPIYLGAPNIELFVPRECYIDAREFPSPEALHNFLIKIDSDSAAKYIESGKAFIRSLMGRQHSYENYANWIIDLAKEHESKI